MQRGRDTLTSARVHVRSRFRAAIQAHSRLVSKDSKQVAYNLYCFPRGSTSNPRGQHLPPVGIGELCTISEKTL